jgi:hypothetical protein
MERCRPHDSEDRFASVNDAIDGNAVDETAIDGAADGSIDGVSDGSVDGTIDG